MGVRPRFLKDSSNRQGPFEGDLDDLRRLRLPDGPAA
jgi:hypothetical protein